MILGVQDGVFADARQEEIRFDRSRLEIRTGSGDHAFDVEIAETPRQRARGLMFRQSLAPDAGMLFLQETDSTMTMWMENTAVPLDMLFFDGRGRIVTITERAVPFSRELISSMRPVRGVLEVKAGTVRRLDVRVAEHRLTRQGSSLPGS